MWRALFVVTVLGATSAAAIADELILKNGDHLTGEITQVIAGKLTFRPVMAGEMTVDLANVKTFSTEKPIDILLNDGSVVKQPATAGSEGTVMVPGAEGGPPVPVLFTNIASINPPAVKWTGAITLSAIVTRGNTKTDSVRSAVDAQRRGENDRTTLGGVYSFGRQEDPNGEMVTSIDNWLLLGKYDRFITKKFYGYGMGKIEHDRIAELYVRAAPGLGVGYQWIERPDMNFFTEAGASWVYEKFEHGDSEDFMAARLAYHVDKKFNSAVMLFHNLEFLPDVAQVSKFLANADAGVRAPLTKSLFCEFKVEWKYNSQPAPGADRNDFRYILGVGWSF